MINLSAVIITKNEAHCIAACLDALAFVDEIVVLDSGSRDRTTAIAEAHGAKVFTVTDWPGFGPQKNRALALASGRWALSIDADEVVSAELRASIQQVVAQSSRDDRAPVHCGYWLNRRSYFCGRLIQHGDWRKDRVLRLFRRDMARFSDDLVHERVICPDPLGTLEGYLLHDSVTTAEEFEEKTLRYARLGAVKLRQRGRGGMAAALTHGGWTFVRGYLLRAGFLDGWRGFVIARQNARGTFMRYWWAANPESDPPNQ